MQKKLGKVHKVLVKPLNSCYILNVAEGNTPNQLEPAMTTSTNVTNILAQVTWTTFDTTASSIPCEHAECGAVPTHRNSSGYYNCLSCILGEINSENNLDMNRPEPVSGEFTAVL